MENNQSIHPSEAEKWNPPPHVVNHLVQHAIRNIPNNQVLIDKIKTPPAQNILMGLKPHVYNDSGFIQFGLMN
jgi:hypothetical protein